jgi:sn-glycerol 3-phosphate transport system permease protein
MKIDMKQWICHFLMIAAVAAALWPVLFMAVTSFKDLKQVFESTLTPFPHPPTWENYQYVLARFPIFRFMTNTAVIAVSVMIWKTVTSLAAGFAFVYYRFRGREYLFNAMLMTFFIPFTVLIMPNYLLISHMGLLNTPYGVILPDMADGMGILLMRQTMRGIPRSLFESAALDGASPFYILRRIVFPLIRPSVISVSILFFINAWNEYFWPLLVLKDKENYTLSLALQMFISAEGGSEWGVAMAVAVLTSLPPLILYLFCQKFILNTFMQSGVKG